MKNLIKIFLLSVILTACSAEVGSDEWCTEMNEKDKGDWTQDETASYLKHCLFK